MEKRKGNEEERYKKEESGKQIRKREKEKKRDQPFKIQRERKGESANLDEGTPLQLHAHGDQHGEGGGG